MYGKITAYQPRRRGKDPRPLCSPAPSPPLPHPRQPSASSFPEDTSIWLYPISPALPMERLMRVCSSPYLTKQQQAGPQSWGRALRTVGSRAGVRYGCCTVRYGLSSTGQDHPSAPGRTTEFPQNPTGAKLWQLDMVLFRKCPHGAVLPLASCFSQSRLLASRTARGLEVAWSCTCYIGIALWCSVSLPSHELLERKKSHQKMAEQAQRPGQQIFWESI